MAFTIDFTPQGVPPGIYRAKFIRAERVESDEYGDGYRFVWEVTDGDQKGQETGRTTSTAMGPRANLPKVLSMILGKDPEPGEQVDLERYYNVPGQITVEETESRNGTRVVNFFRDQPESDKDKSDDAAPF